MVPNCTFSVHTAANMYKREIPRLYSGETIFAMCPLDPEGGGGPARGGAGGGAAAQGEAF